MNADGRGFGRLGRSKLFGERTIFVNPYLADILGQPDALQTALDRFDPAALDALASQVEAGVFDRIVFTGMGSSFFAVYPAWLHLLNRGLPAWHVEASELLHYAPGLVTERTLLCMISQSGRSAEITALIERVRPAHLLAIANGEDNPLAARADTLLLMHAGVETNVSTKTYLNTLAVVQLAALRLASVPLASAQAELQQAVDASRAYLTQWEQALAAIGAHLGKPERLFYLGRGVSLAAVGTGALITKESAKFTVEGLSAGQFRHGPLELADERLSVVVLAGAAHDDRPQSPPGQGSSWLRRPRSLARRRTADRGAVRAPPGRSRSRSAHRRNAALAAHDPPSRPGFRRRSRAIPACRQDHAERVMWQCACETPFRKWNADERGYTRIGKFSIRVYPRSSAFHSLA